MRYKELLKQKKFRWVLASLLLVTPLEILSLLSVSIPVWFRLPLLIIAIGFFGHKVFISGIRSLTRFDFSDINLLMTIATFGAIYLHQFEEAAIIVILFALGDILEEFGIERSQTGLKHLIEGIPKYLEVKGRGGLVAVEEVKIGDVVIVKPGVMMALDGVITAGNSLIDEASITGEPLPKSKHPGDTVYAGTINDTGYLEVQVTRRSEDTTLARIIEMTYQSLEKKSHSQRFIERFAKYYTPSIVIASITLFVFPVFVLGKPLNIWLIQSLTLLIISCPCALVISIPVSVFSAIGNAAQKGAVIKGGRFIEEMGRIKVIAFDKTRTLTKGELTVSDVIAFNGWQPDDVLACAAGIETFSEHPIAKGIVTKAEAHNLHPHPFIDFKAVPGKGLTGQCTVCFDKHHCLGNLRFVTEEHAAEEMVLRKVEEFEKQGKTTVVLTSGKRIKGAIGVTDQIRDESRNTIQTLQKLGVQTVMLTGDNKSSSLYVAQQVNIGTIKAELLPEQKVTELRRLIEEHKHVAMVGDGVNDAPALATASVGIAMGAIGSDVAIENSDIALLNDDLETLPFLVGLGRKCLEKIHFNIASALAVKFLFLFLAIAGWSNLVLAIFADVGITIIVVLNSLSLFSYKGPVT